MEVKDVSFLIPARNEVYLEQTLRDILKNIRGNSEILVALDGYIPDPQIVLNDDRVTFYHYPESIGQRQCINALAKIAKGKFICKLDAHVAIDEGFDVKMMADCKYDETHVPRMYNLDINTWKPKLNKRTDYMYISSPTAEKPFRSTYYGRSQPKNDKLIDDIMDCMGPGWFMHKDRFWELGGMDVSHGSWGQMGIEIACKAWLSGGSLKVNKNTWFAHWFRGDVGFPYEIKGSDQEKARKYSRDLWLNDKWDKATRKLQWMVEKFNPPGWETVKDEVDSAELQKIFYKSIHLDNNNPTWRGVRMVKFPSDVTLYQMAIWDKKPDFIVEIGTAFGGSALMLADMLELTGKGHVITIDLKARPTIKQHPRITYLLGNSTSPEIVNKVKELVGKGSVMLAIDGGHSRVHVKWELMKYKDIVTSGQYMVVEDCYGRDGKIYPPGEAKQWFLGWNKHFIQTDFGKPYFVGMTKDGFLLKK